MEEEDLYPIAKRNANNIISEIQKAYTIGKPDITWKYFKKLLTDSYGVMIESKEFNNVILAKRLAGELVIGPEKALISYNKGIFQSEERQHFTIVHEGVHYMNHKVDHKNGEHYSEILKNGSYSDDELIEETVTNQTASLIMLNDSGLELCMKNRWSFGKIAGFYGMSASALFVRLNNYLHFNLGLSLENSRYLVGRYRYGSSLESRTFLCFFINNFESIKNWIGNGYHAFVHWLTFCNELGYKHVPTSYWYQIKHLLPDSVLEDTI